MRPCATQTTEARRYIENTCCRRGPTRCLPVDDGAPELDRVRVDGGRDVARVAGDALYQDTVDAIERAEARGRRRCTLARAHAAVCAGCRGASSRRPIPDAERRIRAPPCGDLRRGRFAIRVRALTRDGSDRFTSPAHSDEGDPLLNEGHATARRHGYAYAEARAPGSWALRPSGRAGSTTRRVDYEDTLATFTRWATRTSGRGAHPAGRPATITLATRRRRGAHSCRPRSPGVDVHPLAAHLSHRPAPPPPARSGGRIPRPPRDPGRRRDHAQPVGTRMAAIAEALSLRVVDSCRSRPRR